MTHGRGMKISAICPVFGWPGAPYPVKQLATRAHLGNGFFSCMALAQTAYLDGFDVCQRQIGNVHIQQPGLCANLLLLDHHHHQFPRFGGCRVDMKPAFFDLRKSDCGNAKQIGFHRSAYGT